MLQIKDLGKMKQRSEVRTPRGKERTWSKASPTPRGARGWRDIRSMTGASRVRGQRSVETLTGSVDRRGAKGAGEGTLAKPGREGREERFAERFAVNGRN